MPSPNILCAAALATWLFIAVWSDVRTRRIPNLLVLMGIVSGFAIQVLATPGDGLFDGGWGGIGTVQASLGLLAGLLLFMPLYVIRAVGAGDVKLLAMTGVWLGPKLVLGAALLTLVAGGVMALVVMFSTRSSRQVLSNVQTMLTTAVVGVHAGKFTPLDAPASGSVRLPYALAITAGTLAQVGWLLVHASR